MKFPLLFLIELNLDFWLSEIISNKKPNNQTKRPTTRKIILVDFDESTTISNGSRLIKTQKPWTTQDNINFQKFVFKLSNLISFPTFFTLKKRKEALKSIKSSKILEKSDESKELLKISEGLAEILSFNFKKGINLLT